MVGVACRSSSSATGVEPRAPRPLAEVSDRSRLHQLAGTWRWLRAGEVDDTYRIERERWRFDPIATDPAGREVVRGRYRRDLTVIALDGESFVCNQRTTYVQSAIYDVVVTVADGALDVEELGYRTVASPCEPGERALGRYRAAISNAGLALTWDGGAQVLRRAPAGELDAADLDPAPPPGVAGAWRWTLRGHDGKGFVRHEEEAWELAVGDEGELGGTYLREVTTWALDGSPITCAGATSWQFTDRYTVRGSVDGDRLSLTEINVDAGEHPCLAATPTRHLDAAVAERVGDHLVLTWHGDRRQVLHRPD